MELRHSKHRGSIFVLLTCLYSLAFLNLLLMMNLFSGDAEIHLVFVENFLRGKPFLFNLGLPAGGETSPAYMLMLACIQQILGPVQTVVAAKCISYAAFVSIAVLVWHMCGKIGLSGLARHSAPLFVLLCPLMTYNGVFGTENILFAMCVIAWAVALQANPSLSMEDNSIYLISALWFGLLSLIRPESIVIGIGYATMAGVFPRHQQSRHLKWEHHCAFTLLLLLPYLLYCICYYRLTGSSPFVAGSARSYLSRVESIVSIGPLFLNVKFAARIAVYGFLVLIPCLAVRKVGFRAFFVDGLAYRLPVLGILTAGFIAFSAFLPSVHLARYTSFFWPCLFVLFLDSLRSLDRKGLLASLSLLWFFSASGFEIYLRSARFNLRAPGLREAILASEIREKISDGLWAQLKPTESKLITIALQEIQVRRLLDDRFHVLSLEGLVDGDFVKYRCGDHFDYIGYIIHRHIDYLFELPNYNSNKSYWSPNSLSELPYGRIVKTRNVSFERIPVSGMPHHQFAIKVRFDDAAIDNPDCSTKKESYQ